MKHTPRTRALRNKLQKSLFRWIPENKDLVEKELALFDSLVSRREFLKTASFSAMTAFIMHGCGNSSFSGPPSTWSEFDGKPTLVGAEQSTVQTPAKIVVDADIMDGMQSYEALAAVNSSDANGVRDDAVLESFNPHVFTVDSQDSISRSGLKQTNRSYGIPEFVHLSKQSNSQNYSLAIYEKSNNGHHGLQETLVELPNTASMSFDNITAANGSFHNRTKNGTAYSQKLAILADTGHDYDFGGSNVPIMLYYQTNNHALLAPGVDFVDGGSWNQMDIISVFKQNETALSFSKYKVVEVQKYQDGSNNSFIYGTLQFDSYYNYGFVAAFNNIDDTQPTVTFFAPHYLSKKYNPLNKLISDFKGANIVADTDLKSFAVFLKQRFRPLAQTVDANGNHTPNVLFSFFSFDITQNTPTGTAYADNSGNFVLKNFAATDTDIVKQYIISIATNGSARVVYPFSGYTPSISLSTDGMTYLSIVFSTSSSLPVFDIWNGLYERNAYQSTNSFTRFVQSSGANTTLLLATSYYDGASLGVTHKSITIAPNKDGFALVGGINKVNTLFENTSLNGKGYQELWFDDMKSHLNSYKTLAECVRQYSGILDFHCTHNAQGLLRSYYIVRYQNSDKSINSFLIGYNEIGKVDAGATYSYQNFDTLSSDIKNSNIAHNPPLPIAVDAHVMHPWHPIGQDGEVLYTSVRSKMTDETKKMIVSNDGSKGKLLGYNHSVCDNVENTWTRFELEKQVKKADLANKQYLITNHQVHLTVTNIYDHPVRLTDSTYVEVRFSKPVTVRDFTDTQNVKTYHTTRQTSLFLRSGSDGRITLEVDAGTSSSEKYQGATMMYRFLDASAIRFDGNTPVGVLANTNGSTSAYKQCNISFNAYDRLSGTVQSGATNNASISTTLKGGFGEGTDSAVTSVKSAYGSLRDAAKPDNNSPARNLREVYANRITIRGLRSVELRSGAGAPIDPLTHVTIIGGAGAPKRSRGWWSSFTHWVSHAVSTVVNTVVSAVKTAAGAVVSAAESVANAVVRAAESVANSIKNVITKLADDIKNIAVQIGNSIANAVVNIAAAIVKLAKTIYDAALWLWNFIKMLLDMRRCYDIGQELKRLYHDQFDKNSTVAGNAYSVLKNNTSVIQSAVGSTFDTLKTSVDGAIDSAFGSTSTLNNYRDQSNSQQRNMQANSTKTNYVLDQTQRSANTNAPASAAVAPSAKAGSAVCSLDSPADELLVCLASKIASKTVDGIVQMAKDTGSIATDFFGGKGMESVKAGIGKLLKDSINLMLDDAKTLTVGAVQLPLSILNGSALLDYFGKSLEFFERLILDALGLLLFFDPTKFKTAEDFVYFCFGFIINVAGAIFSVAGLSFNIGDYIKSGDFRNDINSIGKRGRQVRDVTFQKVAAVGSSIDGFISTLQTVVKVAITTANAVGESAAVNKLTLIKGILNYGFLVRAGCRAAVLANAFKTDNKVQIVNQFSQIGNYLSYFTSSQIEGNLAKYEDGQFQYAAVAINVFNTISRICAVVDANSKNDGSKQAVLSLASSVIMLIQAPILLYTDFTAAGIASSSAPQYESMSGYYAGMALSTLATLGNVGISIEQLKDSV